MTYSNTTINPEWVAYFRAALEGGTAVVHAPNGQDVIAHMRAGKEVIQRAYMALWSTRATPRGEHLVALMQAAGKPVKWVDDVGGVSAMTSYRWRRDPKTSAVPALVWIRLLEDLGLIRLDNEPINI